MAKEDKQCGRHLRREVVLGLQRGRLNVQQARHDVGRLQAPAHQQQHGRHAPHLRASKLAHAPSVIPGSASSTDHLLVFGKAVYVQSRSGLPDPPIIPDTKRQSLQACKEMMPSMAGALRMGFGC